MSKGHHKNSKTSLTGPVFHNGKVLTIGMGTPYLHSYPTKADGSAVADEVSVAPAKRDLVVWPPFNLFGTLVILFLVVPVFLQQRICKGRVLTLWRLIVCMFCVQCTVVPTEGLRWIHAVQPRLVC